jgi:hypothetical protein
LSGRISESLSMWLRSKVWKSEDGKVRELHVRRHCP